MRPISLSPVRKTPPGIRLLRFLAAIVLVVFLPLALLAIFRVGPPPVVEITPAVPGIGQRTPITVKVEAAGRGLKDLQVDLVQGDKVVPLAAKTYTPRPYWAFWGAAQTSDVLELTVGRQTQKELQRGEATLRVEAGRAGTPLRTPEPVVQELTLPVRFDPPSLAARSPEPDVVWQGGSGVAVYHVGEGATRHGIRVGSYEFPGAPMPGGEKGLHFAFFGVPFDESNGLQSVRLFAVDALGNEATRTFLQRYDPRQLKADTINLDDRFLERTTSEILGATPGLEDQGDPLKNYLAINRDLRKANEAALVALAAKTQPRLAWHGPFRQMPNSGVMAGFAAERAYFYQGAQVDRQFHLGYDLASTQRAPVPAANAGTVVLAEYFGIYGNTVVVDHGYGVMSLYSHLSSLGVAVGDKVEKGQSVGQTGLTGLAGGDHLHFGILIHGLQVDPLEWLDAHWLKTRIANKLAPAFQVLD
jgi:murein DD-endopeptidase MepM/ murein hydrolase activator NlpD